MTHQKNNSPKLYYFQRNFFYHIVVQNVDIIQARYVSALVHIMHTHCPSWALVMGGEDTSGILGPQIFLK